MIEPGMLIINQRVVRGCWPFRKRHIVTSVSLGTFPVGGIESVQEFEGVSHVVPFKAYTCIYRVLGVSQAHKLDAVRYAYAAHANKDQGVEPLFWYLHRLGDNFEEMLKVMFPQDLVAIELLNIIIANPDKFETVISKGLLTT